MRFGKVLMPFLSLYKPISQPVSIVKKSISMVSLGSQLYGVDKDRFPLHLLQTSLAIAVLIATLFGHPIRKGITKGKSITMDAKNLFHHFRQGDQLRAAEHGANILKNALYLGLLLNSSIELVVASFALKTFLRLYHAHSEYQQGNHLESAGYLALAAAKTAKQVLPR